MERTTHTRRRFLKLAALGGAAVLAPRRLTAAAEKTPAARPNILFILTDDQGWADGKRFGHPYMKTPALDRLASEGAWFHQFYVSNPVCSPSRTAFLTGHYPARHGVHGHFARPAHNRRRGMPNWLDAKVTTVCDLLQAAGYRTAHFGKWHLTNGWSKDAPPPGEYGIDVHRTVNSSGPGFAEQRAPFFRAKSTGLFVDETIRFIESCKGRPFYVNLWTLVPHATLKPTPRELAVYEGLKVSPADFPGYMRPYVRSAKDMTAQMKVFCASMTGLDRALGRLLDYLDKKGLADSTLIVFTSDNGPEDYHVRNAANAGMGYPSIFRGRKRSVYEGGVRMPCLVRWPGKVKAGRVDKESVLAAVDFLPTVCGLAGVAVPKELQPDGEDVGDILVRGPRPRRRPIFWEWRFGVAGNRTYKPPQLAIREGKWKLFTSPRGGKAELYDIPADPEERSNIAAEHTEVVAQLKKKLLAWKATLPE